MYHTKYDAVQYTVGGEKSLWSMMETARGIAIGLLKAHTSRAEVVMTLSISMVSFDLPRRVYMPTFMRNSVQIGYNHLSSEKLVDLQHSHVDLGPLFLIMLIFCETIVLEAAQVEQFFPYPIPQRASYESFYNSFGGFGCRKVTMLMTTGVTLLQRKNILARTTWLR